ncbi:complex I subunit 5 family protein [Alkalispirochaeta alkalica]|uniref:complex I subunit 5 family protein n=1 Tax=Alkalispirochaeta alkalica TaxID=46356 RepID=UPI000362F1E0|nr:proton-conducting transporter membrane subunit [Alkalispirochaeta alkalica]
MEVVGSLAPGGPFWIPLHGIVLLPVIAAALAFAFPRAWYQNILLGANGVLTLVAVLLFRQVRWGGSVVQSLAGWHIPVAITLRADQLSTPWVLLTAVFFTGAFLFSTRGTYRDKTFLFLFMVLEAAILGIFLSGDIFNIYVLMELGMLSIAILIMYKQEKQAVYDAMLYLMMNFIAMAFMLLGIGYLYRLTGVLDLQEIHLRLMDLDDPRAGLVPYALIMTAVALKSALLPLFGWLPRAHGAASAPAIVSAVLSGVQVKAGVYLLVRLGQVFQPLVEAELFFMVLGFLTSTAGFLLAIAQKDIKLILAYHTVSQVGLIVMGLNMGSQTAFWGGMYHMINHALFKGVLFLTAGIIIEEYGTRSYAEIRGVFRRMPALGIATIAGVLGITGAPFFNGSISKYFIHQGLQGSPAELGLYLINFGTILSFVKYSTILLGPPPATPPSPRDPYVATVSLLFGGACLAGGLFGSAAVELFFGPLIPAGGALAPEKIALFAATLVLALLTYRFLVCRMGEVLQAVRIFKFSFNQVTVFMTLFFAALLGYAYLVA